MLVDDGKSVFEVVLNRSPRLTNPAVPRHTAPITCTPSQIAQDKDLAPLRERREWLDALDSLKGGISDSALVQLRSEAKAPFRLARTILVGGLLAGAALGLLFITAKLVQSLQGVPLAAQKGIYMKDLTSRT
jgi:hypothetical protein